MRSLDTLHPDTLALVLDSLPLRTEEHLIHAWAAIDEAREGIDPYANLAYAERRYMEGLRLLIGVPGEDKRMDLAAELCRVASDLGRLRSELEIKRAC